MIDSMSRGPKWFACLAAAALVPAMASGSAAAQPAPEAAPAPETYPHMGKTHEIMVGPDTWFRFGVQAQLWINYQQSPTRVDDSDGGYAFDELLRRARFIVAAQLVKNVSAFILFDSPNLGRTTVTGSGDTLAVSKNFSPAIVQDAFAELKVAGDAFMIEGGLMVLPFSYNGLQSTTSYRVLDVSSTAAVLAGAATSAFRDVGLQFKGYLLDSKLEYRVGAFSGLRQGPDGADPAGHNPPRVAGRLHYQFFDVEKGYVYSGHTFGKRKLLGVGAGFDFQKPGEIGGASATAHKAFSAGVFGAWPLAGAASPEGGDELAFLGEFYRYDGGTAFAAIPKQNDVNAEVAYYNKGMRTSFFGRFEMQKFADDAVGQSGPAGNKLWFGAGLKYYVAESNLNFTLAYNRVQFPDADETAVNSTNQFTMQMQAFYY